MTAPTNGDAGNLTKCIIVTPTFVEGGEMRLDIQKREGDTLRTITMFGSKAQQAWSKLDQIFIEH